MLRLRFKQRKGCFFFLNSMHAFNFYEMFEIGIEFGICVRCASMLCGALLLRF